MDNGAAVQAVITCFKENGFAVSGEDGNGAWISAKGRRVRIRDAVVCMAAPTVIKVDVIPPLENARFESSGGLVDSHLSGEFRLLSSEGRILKTYKNSYLSISKSGIERVVVVFSIPSGQHGRAIDEDIIPLMSHALGIE